MFAALTGTRGFFLLLFLQLKKLFLSSATLKLKKKLFSPGSTQQAFAVVRIRLSFATGVSGFHWAVSYRWRIGDEHTPKIRLRHETGLLNTNTELMLNK